MGDEGQESRPGEVVGRFVLERPLGRGAVGEVWRARHLDSGTPAAVKVVGARWLDFPGALEGFEHEVAAASSLLHPNVVLLLDHGRHERAGAVVPWLAMELVNDGSLHDLRSSLGWSEVRSVLLELLDALAYAHARGVIHRDVKPGNVLVEEGHAKLADFGLAHRFGEGLGGNALIGTPSFMAPEQIEADHDSLGPWTDLYGLACLAWTLITGHPPFRGEGRLQVLAGHLDDEPPPLEARFEVPEALEEWLRWLLRKDPRLRPLLAADAKVALSSLSIGRRSYRPRPPSVPGSWRSDDELPHLGVVRASTAAFRVRHVPMVGREPERDRLWAALTQAIDRRRPGVVTLEGPTGSGKSRLGQWLRERACERGVALPLVLDADATLEAALRPYRAQLDADGEAGLAALASRRPVVLHVEDAERNPEALQLVSRLCRQQPLALLAVLTIQPEDLALRPVEARLLSELPHRRIAVDPLPAPRLRELVADLLHVRNPVVQALVEQAGGSPRYVLEVLRDWVDRGVLVTGPDGLEPRAGARVELPASVRQVWEQRLARLLSDLDPQDAVALELGALLGARVACSEWEAACAAYGVAPSESLLPSLEAAGLVRVDRWPPTAWTLAQGMLRDAIRARSREGGRWEALHRACALALTAEAADARSPRLWGRLGHHLLRAGTPAEAIDPLLASLGHPDAADEHHLRDLLTALEAAGVEEPDPRWGQAWNAAADVAALVGGELDDIDWSALTIAAGMVHGWLPALAAGHARSALRLARLGEPEAALEAALRGVRLASHAEAEVQLDAQTSLARVAAAGGRWSEALPLLEQLTVRYAALGRRREAGGLAVDLAQLLKASGDAAGAERWNAQARRWLEESGARADVALCDEITGDLARERGDLDAAGKAYEAASRRRRGARGSVMRRVELGRALTLLASGDIAGARERADAVLVSARADRSALVVALARLVVAHDELARDRADAAEELLAEVLAAVREARLRDPDLASAATSLARLARVNGHEVLAIHSHALAVGQYAALGRQEPAEPVAAQAERTGK